MSATSSSPDATTGQPAEPTIVLVRGAWRSYGGTLITSVDAPAFDTEVDASYAVMISHPDVVADVITQAASSRP